MNRSDIYADPVKFKRAGKRKREDMVYSSGERDADPGFSALRDIRISAAVWI